MKKHVQSEILGARLYDIMRNYYLQQYNNVLKVKYSRSYIFIF